MDIKKQAVVSPLFQTFETDPELEKNGITLQYGTTERMIDGEKQTVPIEIIIARAGGHNTQYDKVFETLCKPYKRMIQADALDPEKGKQIMRETFARTVIKGWNNMQDKEGNFIEFSKKAAEKQMEELPELFADVAAQANKMSLFRAVVDEVDAKN